MKRYRPFDVYTYVGNDPNPINSVVMATNAGEVRLALINAYGEDGAQDYSIRPMHSTAGINWRNALKVVNGRFVEREDDE